MPVLTQPIKAILTSFSNSHSLPTFRELESASPKKLSDGIKKFLSDRYRSGCPGVFTQVQILRIMDLACKTPADFDYEVSQWSLNLLVEEIVSSKCNEN